MATEPVYCTRERVKAATSSTSFVDALVDDAIGAASRIIDSECHRKFYPTTATRSFDWPPDQTSRSWRLWLDNNELVSLASLTVAGTSATVGSFLLEPVNEGPPYTHLEANLSTSAAFSASTTHQRAIALTGVFGYDNITQAAGTTAANQSDTTGTSLTITNDTFGVGDLITINSERLFVSELAFADVGKNTNSTVAAQKNDDSIPIETAHGIIAGDRIRINTEEMTVRALVGATSLTVDRATNGTTLAAHGSGDDVYAIRTATVERGATGSTAATSTSGAAITRQVYQPLIEQWCVAEAVVQLSQQSAGYARTAGSGDNQRETIGRGLVDIRARALGAHGRRHRMASV